MALAGQVNVQAGPNMSMAQQQVNLPANSVTAAGQQVNLAHAVARAQQQYAPFLLTTPTTVTMINVLAGINRLGRLY